MGAVPECVLTSDVRLFLDGTGRLRSSHPAGTYDHWRPFVQIFGSAVVMARLTREVDVPDCGPADGNGVMVIPIPDYHGLGQMIRALPKVVGAVWRVTLDQRMPVVRLPEPLSMLLAIRAWSRRTPYVVLLVADVRTFFASAYSSMPFSSAVGRLLGWIVARMVRGSAGVVYVTGGRLQQTYPGHPDAPALVRSNVRVDADEIGADRSFPSSRRLIAIGSQQSNIKGHDTAIKALRVLRQSDPRYELVLVGDGRLKAELRHLAVQEDVEDRVTFTGQLPHHQVVSQLRQSDMILMPSRSEGLPRALIEGMAVGLPAIGSDVGGIPELVVPECLVRPDDPEELAAVVRRVFDDPDCWIRMSRANVRRAQEVIDSTSVERLQTFVHEVLGRPAPQR